MTTKNHPQPPAAGEAAHTPYSLNLASRSFSNESKGADMFASISKDGIALAFIPHGPTAQASAPFIVRACNAHAGLLAFLATFAADDLSKLTFDEMEEIIRAYQANARELLAAAKL